jgi:2-keto-4-pentenoate hydratase/2-oxohepta-3-ene-1,7-dioic acid hydratase in catechol pathway
VRLLTFEKQRKAAVGIRLGEEVVDLSEAAPDLPRDIAALLAAGPEALARAEAAAARARVRLPLSAIRHLVPVPFPDKNIGLGLNYLHHIREMNPDFPIPEFPGMFMRVPSSIVAHNEAIVRPAISDTLDYEGEFMVVIGRPGRHIPVERALDHVAGYTCHNDGSVREYNQWPMSITAGKNFYRTGGIGPEIVTADELPPGCKGLRLRTRVNGELRQDEDLANMHWDVANLIHLMSRLMPLLPGDLLTTGTPPGVGAGFKPPKYLRGGDVVEVEIEGLGILVNPISDEKIEG